MYSQDIGIEFRIEKCDLLIMRSGKRLMMEGIELPDKKKKQNCCRKGNLLVLGNTRSGHHQTSGDKRKKLKQTLSEERGNYSKSIYIVEI